MLNHSGSTIDRLKIIVKWGTFRPGRTLCHVIGGQGDIKLPNITEIAPLALRAGSAPGLNFNLHKIVHCLRQ